MAFPKLTGNPSCDSVSIGTVGGTGRSGWSVLRPREEEQPITNDPPPDITEEAVDVHLGRWGAFRQEGGPGAPLVRSEPSVLRLRRGTRSFPDRVIVLNAVPARVAELRSEPIANGLNLFFEKPSVAKLAGAERARSLCTLLLPSS